MASLVVLECAAEPAPAAQAGVSMASKLQQLKLRQQEAKRNLKARLSASLGREPVAYPVELSAASLPIHGAFPKLQDQGRVASLPLLDDLEEASLIGTAVDPMTRPGTSSSVTSVASRVSSAMAVSVQGVSRPATSYSTFSSDSYSRPTTGARTGRSCDLVSAASLLSLESVGSAEDVGKAVLRPCVDPAAVLAAALKTLATCNAAKRLDLDWQAQNEAIVDCRRLVCYHSAVIQGSLHAITMALLPSVDALRSSTGKEALSVFQEMTQTATMVKALDQEIEQIVPVVLKKAGEMSQAGRETFLAAEASGLLTAMADCLSVARVAAAVMACIGHKSPSVRCKAAMHLDACVQGQNGQRLAGQQGMVARALKAAAELAGEGQQDTRTYAKRAVFALAALAKATEAGGLERLLSRMPEAQRKLVADTLEKCSSLPSAPARRMPGRR